MSNDTLSGMNMPLNVVEAASSKRGDEEDNRSVSLRRRLRRWLWHVYARQFTLLSVIAVRMAGWIGRRRRTIDGDGCEIMLTGRFDSDNWILAFLGPLSAAKRCSRLWMVSTNPVPEMPKVEAIYPPGWMMKLIGATGARLLTFMWSAAIRRPQFVGGFYLVANGVAAAIAGRLTGARSMYFCTGGPVEILDGGVHSQDNVTSKMETADVVVERRLFDMVSQFDAIVTMGTGAVGYFQRKGVDVDFHVVPGAIDEKRFHPAENVPSADIVLTGRLAPIKRIDIFLLAVRHIVERLPELRVVIVGDGDMRRDLQRMSTELGVDRHVNFTGYLGDGEVVGRLRDSRIFVLTSDSEGLSLSMMEAMMCGLPAVVSDVGDLGDLVEDGVNGYLVPRRSPEKFAARIIELLTDAEKLKKFSQAARRSALRYTVEATSAKWDDIIRHHQAS
jgi:glycosyltransferase involved in cell wall biosynthesis